MRRCYTKEAVIACHVSPSHATNKRPRTHLGRALLQPPRCRPLTLVPPIGRGLCTPCLTRRQPLVLFPTLIGSVAAGGLTGAVAGPLAGGVAAGVFVRAAAFAAADSAGPYWVRLAVHLVGQWVQTLGVGPR